MEDELVLAGQVWLPAPETDTKLSVYDPGIEVLILMVAVSEPLDVTATRFGPLSILYVKV